MASTGRHRLLAWLGSTAVHATLLVAALALSMNERREAPHEPAPLIYIEPAPPPPLGGASDGSNVQPAHAPVPQQQTTYTEPRAATPEPRLTIARKQESKKPPEATAPKPKPIARAVDQPKTTATPTPVESAAEPNKQERAQDEASRAGPGAAQEPANRGEPGGVLGGTSGGKPGGVLGGHGDEVLSDAHVSEPPVVISRVIPQYPQLARARGIEGQVLLEVIVDRDGLVEPEIKVLDSVPIFNDAAISALRQWRFRPGRDRGGRPARVVVRVPVKFRLR